MPERIRRRVEAANMPRMGMSYYGPLQQGGARELGSGRGVRRLTVRTG